MKLHLGCPVWGCTAWRGTLLPARCPRERFLAEYSRRFNTVEGNSTFYSTPTPAVVQGWANSVAPGFRFALKFPRVVTHEQRFAGSENESRRFLDLLWILDDAGCLGPTFIQLPPTFSFESFGTLEAFLAGLPRDLPFAVEPRHRDYFDEGPHERAFDQLLSSLKMRRTLFDSRALFSRPPDDATETESQRRKPRSPYRTTVLSGQPFLRFVARNRLEQARVWIEEWAAVIAGWLAEGHEPYVFAHSPDDAHAPAFARELHTAISRHISNLAPLPDWADEQQPVERQLKLFDME